MNKVKFLVLMVAVLPVTAFAKPVAIDTAASTVNWVGNKVTGQHNGTVNLKSGEVDIEGSSITGGQFEVDMTSIKVLDITDAENNGKLVGHLKSDDFFGVDKYPSANFKITKINALKSNKEATHEITGDITIKGIKQSVKFPAQVEVKDGKGSAKGKFSVDRTKHHIRYGSGKFFQNLGDKMIDDKFEVSLDLKTK